MQPDWMSHVRDIILLVGEHAEGGGHGEFEARAVVGPLSRSRHTTLEALLAQRRDKGHVLHSVREKIKPHIVGLSPSRVRHEHIVS